MNCPEHPEQELRIEYHGGVKTGFCLRCPKHYPMCLGTRYMTSCELFDHHEGPHRGPYGIEWSAGHPGDAGYPRA